MATPPIEYVYFRGGETVELTALYDQHADRLYRFVHHAVGVDAVQAIVERVWAQVAFDPKPTTLYRTAVAAVYHRRSPEPPIPLPEDNLQRLALLLRFAAGLGSAQIAAALDVPHSHAQSLLDEGLMAVARRAKAKATS